VDRVNLYFIIVIIVFSGASASLFVIDEFVGGCRDLVSSFRFAPVPDHLT
jgi:hypothetical protein